MIKENTVPLSKKYEDTQANVLQRRAATPESSVWVGASAGSGKTKVLTDRILRLLLPSAVNFLGASPHKILGLTFTKAGASEMALRINQRLSEWAVTPLEDLNKDLKDLLGIEASKEQIIAARQLFARVVDTPGGLKIMTIHSFCQSVLGRFPLEADLPPNFKALEEKESDIFLKRATDKVFLQSSQEKGSPLAQALYHIASTQNDQQFKEILKKLISERRQLHQILKDNFGIEGLYTALCQSLDIPAGTSAEEIISNFCILEPRDEEALRHACGVLARSTGKNDKELALDIQKFLDTPMTQRSAAFYAYRDAMLTTKKELYKNYCVKKIRDEYPEVEVTLRTEATRILELHDNLKSVQCAETTRDLFLIGQEILSAYEALKFDNSALDYDDLILKTLDLLQGNTHKLTSLKNNNAWVRYKLDQGIDHILVDEAQDTNPEQWEIIQALCDDFFDGSGAQDNLRTLFVVGDEKQSIFKFQRASPEKFKEMKSWFSQKIKAANKQFDPVQFNISFRSTKPILELVDSIFAPALIRQGVSEDVIEHEAYRQNQAGLVELWPLFETEKKEDISPWNPPVDIIDSTSGAAQMAAYTAQQIEGWITSGERLESYDRGIKAGDILILMRARNKFIDQLVKALKSRNIPVSGVDRMVLNDQLIVEDLCAAAQFALLPDDDLTLASLLKSPFIGWNEEALFKAAYNRPASLWARVQHQADDVCIAWLKSLIKCAGQLSPYEFFAKILQESCPADSRSGLRAVKKRLGEDCLDPLDEFLNSAIEFEKNSIPSLQYFIQNQMSDDTQIKRQMEEAGNAVRIMTVHGAKGLQAPIVIMPDTALSNKGLQGDRIYWPDQSGSTLPYYAAKSEDMSEKISALKDRIKVKQLEEYRRLLYVGLTRAESRLYVGGYQGNQKIHDESWYHIIKSGFETLPHIEEIPFEGDEDKIILRAVFDPVNSEGDKKGKDKISHTKKIPLEDAPSWLFEKIEEEAFPPKPLRPSRPSEDDSAALSPLEAGTDYRFKRGNITHRLLQILPDLPVTQREQAARTYVSQPAHQISQPIQDDILQETFKILNDPIFAPIFGAGSMAEVPITGLIDGKTPISGQIDRLLITPDEILIIDYKTNRPPPTNVEDVPALYINQMAAYREIMSALYPARAIKCALIWTDGAQLMNLN